MVLRHNSRENMPSGAKERPIHQNILRFSRYNSSNGVIDSGESVYNSTRPSIHIQSANINLLFRFRVSPYRSLLRNEVNLLAVWLI